MPKLSDEAINAAFEVAVLEPSHAHPVKDRMRALQHDWYAVTLGYDIQDWADPDDPEQIAEFTAATKAHETQPYTGPRRLGLFRKATTEAGSSDSLAGIVYLDKLEACTPDEHTPLILQEWDIFNPNERGLGLGEYLLKTALTYLAHPGDPIRLRVVDRNPVEHYYRKQAFQDVPRGDTLETVDHNPILGSTMRLLELPQARQLQNVFGISYVPLLPELAYHTHMPPEDGWRKSNFDTSSHAGVYTRLGVNDEIHVTDALGSPPLQFNRNEIDAFVKGAKQREFDDFC